MPNKTQGKNNGGGSYRNICDNLFKNGEGMMRNRRVDKTKQALFQALSKLLEQKRYSEINVQEIIDVADVGRTTFYAHFYSKDELLKAYIEKISDSLGHPISQGQNNIEPENVFTMPVRGLFEHIQENITQIRGVIADSASADILFHKIKMYWEKRLMDATPSSVSPLPTVPAELFINHIIQTLIEVIRWWIQTGMEYTPQEMEQYYHQLTFSVCSKE